MNASFLAYYLKQRFAVVERGASLVEYTLILALVAIAAIVGLNIVGSEANEKLTDVGTEMNNAGCPSGQTMKDHDSNASTPDQCAP